MTKVQYILLLISVTVCWSVENVLMKNIPSDVSSFAVMAMTNGLGFIILGTIFFNDIKKNVKRKDVLYALLLSVMNLTYNFLIINALRFISSAAASFIVSFTIALIPIILFLMGRKISLGNVIGTFIIVLGIVISGTGNTDSNNIIGLEMMAVVCVIRAFYIIKMNDFAKKSIPSVLAVLTELFVALISFIIWFVTEPKTFFALKYSNEMISSVFMEGYFICGYAVFVNMIAQKYASPQTCGAVYSFQIIFAVIISAIIPEMLGEAVPLTFLKLLACFVIVSGAIISETDIVSLLREKIMKYVRNRNFRQ